MSDECLMKQETVFSFYTQYQAVMRKFTLAGKAPVIIPLFGLNKMIKIIYNTLFLLNESGIPLLVAAKDT